MTQTVTINTVFIRTEMETDENGYTPAGYTAMTIKPGKFFGKLSGDFELVPDNDPCVTPNTHVWVVINGSKYNLDGAVYNAERGLLGLSLNQKA